MLLLTSLTLLLTSTVHAYHYRPALIWSSSSKVEPKDIIHNTAALCAHDAILLVSHPGLHPSDLRSLPKTSFLSQVVAERGGYTTHQEDEPSLSAQTIADSCGAQIITLSPGDPTPTLSRNKGSKHVVCLNMPSLETGHTARRALMRDHEQLFKDVLGSLASSVPNHLVYYTSPASIDRRQHDGLLDSLVPDNTTTTPLTIAPSTPIQGGILARYQLLTPGLITILLFVLFVFLPILFVGISALAAIQSPLKAEVPKGFSAGDRKNQ